MLFYIGLFYQLGDDGVLVETFTVDGVDDGGLVGNGRTKFRKLFRQTLLAARLLNFTPSCRQKGQIGWSFG